VKIYLSIRLSIYLSPHLSIHQSTPDDHRTKITIQQYFLRLVEIYHATSNTPVRARTQQPCCSDTTTIEPSSPSIYHASSAASSTYAICTNAPTIHLVASLSTQAQTHQAHQTCQASQAGWLECSSSTQSHESLECHHRSAFERDGRFMVLVTRA